MPTQTSNVRRTQRVVGLLAVVAAALVLSGCLNEHGERSFELLNAERRAHGRAELVNDFDLNTRAQQWADQMAASGRLAHSGYGIPPGSTRVAENVGVGSNADNLHRALMNSAPHRANILDSRVTKIGIGTTVGPDGRLWLVQIFAN